MDIKTKMIEKILFLFNFSLKKILKNTNYWHYKISKTSIYNSFSCDSIYPYRPINKNEKT